MPDKRDKKVRYKTLRDLYSDPEMIGKFERLRALFTQGDKSLHDRLFNVYDNPEATKSRRFGGTLPYVPRPSMFQPDPLVVGSPAEAVLAKRILDLDPGTKQRVRNITFGPNRGTMIDAGEYEVPIDEFGERFVGRAPHTGEVSVFQRSRLGDFEPLLNAEDTLAHEIGHRAGHTEYGANKAGGILSGTYDEDLIFPPRRRIVR